MFQKVEPLSTEMEFMKVQFHFIIFQLRFLPSFLPFYKMLFINKLEFSSVIDCFVLVSEKRDGSVFCQDFLFTVHFYLLFLQIIMHFYINKCNIRKNNATFKGKQAANVNNAQFQKTIGGVGKSAGGDDCEYCFFHVAWSKVLKVPKCENFHLTDF